MQDWLCRENARVPYRAAGQLMGAIVANDRQAYLCAQAEALSWLNWMKKFAVAYLKMNKGGKGVE